MQEQGGEAPTQRNHNQPCQTEINTIDKAQAIRVTENNTLTSKKVSFKYDTNSPGSMQGSEQACNSLDTNLKNLHSFKPNQPRQLTQDNTAKYSNSRNSTTMEARYTAKGRRVKTAASEDVSGSVHNEVRMVRLSPKNLPSHFTYQTQDTEMGGQQEFIAHVANCMQTQERYQEEGRVYLELRYCKKCNNQQALRSKHCRKCQKCIATFDHHCPWLGTCIGEKNKAWFYFYLWAQLILLGQLEYLAVRMIVEERYLWVGYLMAILAGLFIVFVLNLLGFHSYLIAVNITTWEQLSWNKITYLNNWKRSFGSPFDLGFKENVKLVFKQNLAANDMYVWKMPYKYPSQ